VSAYIIASYDIADAKGYEGYVPGVVPLLQKHGAEILVASYDAQALEGDRRDVYLVLKFASEAAALAWYNDPAYTPVKRSGSMRARTAISRSRRSSCRRRHSSRAAQESRRRARRAQREAPARLRTMSQ